MSLRRKHIRTEHTGGKNGGGFWGKRTEAKETCDQIRRQADKAEVEEQLSGFVGHQGVFNLAGRLVACTVVEDRGCIGVGGRRLLRVERLDGTELEIPAEEISFKLP